jgi:hypothetical protein
VRVVSNPDKLERLSEQLSRAMPSGGSS